MSNSVRLRRIVLIKAAQGFSVRRTPVRRRRKLAEIAEQGKKGHLWMDTDEFFVDSVRDGKIASAGPHFYFRLQRTVEVSATGHQ